MRERRLTRAALAAGTGISKPTVSDSVRRLADAGFPVRTAEVTAEPSLAGVRADALLGLRSAIINAARGAATAGSC